MLEWLIELLTPFFTSLGVSAADINSYIHSLSIYIYYRRFTFSNDSYYAYSLLCGKKRCTAYY